MAVRFDNSGEEYARSLSLGSVTNWTVTCWAKLMVDRAATSVIWMIDDGSGGNYLRLTGWNGSALAYQTTASSWFGLAGQTLVVGEWTFIGLSSTANPGVARVRVRTAGSTTWIGGTPPQNNVTITAGTLRIAAGQAAGEWLNGSVAGLKVWDQALSMDELELESWTYQPQRTAGLRAWYPLLRPDGTDYSGAGQTLSGGAGAALDDGPPLSWSSVRRRIVLPAAAPPPSGPTFRSASQVASGTNSSFNCPKPAGVAQGDILVAFHAADTGSLAEMATPTGGSAWQLLTSRARDDGTGSGSKVWWKVAGAAEPATYGFTQTGNADGSVSIIAVQDGSTDTPVVAQTGGTSSGTTKTTPSTTAGAGDFEIRCVALHSPGGTVTFTSPAGFTERTDIQSAAYGLTTTATRTLASGGATGTADFTASTSVGEWHGFTVNIGSMVTLKSLADSATGSEAVDVSVDAPIADSATAAETLTVAASVDFADTAAAADDLSVTVTVGFSDTATADDAALVGFPVDLADAASADDTWTILPTPVFDEQAAAGESLTVAATAAFTDSATATDDLAVIQTHNKDLADSATATESLTVVTYQDIDVVAGAPRRGWTSQPFDRGWSAGDASRGWSAGPPTT
ncbi:hypothetical protein ACIBG4_40650 [Nonomuraea sp. NPDC050383]|uniref:hypothetical protein n=1 Tax=Nonomuraea sp. NPDC050383 TaxID=3364362 RepID=UPI00378A5ECE